MKDSDSALTAVRPEGCRISSQAGVSVVSVPRFVDISNEYLFRSALLEASIGARVVIVDMTVADHFGATGINALVWIGKRLRKAGGELRLVVRSPHIMRTLEVVEIPQFPIFTNVPEALALGRRDMLAYNQAA